MEFKYDTCNFTDFERVSEINTTDNFTTKKKIIWKSGRNPPSLYTVEK